MVAQNNSELMTVKDVAEFLKVPRSWVYERTRRGAIPVRKLGGHVRIPRDELLAWVDREGKTAHDSACVPNRQES